MNIDREKMDSGQFPDWSEFERVDELLTEVRPKKGFYFGFGSGEKNWRVVATGTTLYIEHWNGSAWIEKARLEA